MKTGQKKLKNWKWLSQILTWWKFQSWTSGAADLRYLYSAIFFVLAVLGYLQKIDDKDSIVELILYTALFSILGILNLLLKSNYVLIISNIILGCLTIFDSSYANLTGLLFILPVAYIISFSIKKKNLYYPLFGFLFLIVVINEKIDGRGVFETGMVLCGYLFFTYIYYYIIHIPTQKLKEENEKLKSRLQIIGTAKHMTDDDILYYYPVMKHHDEEKKYLKINMIRDFANGASKKALAINYDCSEKTVKRYFDAMKDDFSDRLGLKKDDRIFEDQHLTTVCTEMDIIQVIVRQKEY